MSSSVFFRFKSQKEPSRVTFDGTGISVFELKREIITMNRLGDGTDFELSISSEDIDEVYDDDTSIIPRSTTIIARRLPAAKPGRGGAARYVSGKMPQNAKNTNRSDITTSKAAMQGSLDTSSLSNTNGAQTEDQKIAAMFKMGADQWEQQQQHMANVTPVHRSGLPKGKGSNSGRDGVPPPGYLCYRCGEKGHWIQSCPTNNDPTFDGKPRVKRTTGIPRSFLTKIEKPTTLANDGTVDDSKPPPGAMVNAEGEWVVAEPDKASWEQYHAKAKVSAAAQEVAARGSKELQKRGLECTIDKRLFVEPTKTPCCQTTYCLECITDALLENDLRCPACSTDNILIDDLKPDDEKAADIRRYEDEENAASTSRENSKSPKVEEQNLSQVSSPPSKPGISSPVSDTASKKRRADFELKNDRVPPGKNTTDPKQSIVNGTNAQTSNQATQAPPKMPPRSEVPFPASSFMLPQGMDSAALQMASAFTGMPMTMAPMMGMGLTMFDPMAMQNASTMGGSNGNWNAMWGAGFPQQNIHMSGAGIANGMTGKNFYGQQNMHVPTNYSFMSNGIQPNGQTTGSFVNQQRNVFSASTHNEEDSAYFRKPVNPHRHQARRNVNRPTDYREI